MDLQSLDLIPNMSIKQLQILAEQVYNQKSIPIELQKPLFIQWEKNQNPKTRKPDLTGSAHNWELQTETEELRVRGGLHLGKAPLLQP